MNLHFTEFLYVFIQNYVWKMQNLGRFFGFWPNAISKLYHPKCRIWILAFFTNFCPIKIELSGNIVWLRKETFVPKMKT